LSAFLQSPSVAVLCYLCSVHALTACNVILLLSFCACLSLLLLLLLQLLYQDWLKLPPQLMTVKEAVLLLQRLAYVQDRFDADPATCAKWHCLFLDIVYNICTSSTLPQVRHSGTSQTSVKLWSNRVNLVTAAAAHLADRDDWSLPCTIACKWCCCYLWPVCVICHRNAHRAAAAAAAAAGAV
jgi:hypothetical protein